MMRKFTLAMGAIVATLLWSMLAASGATAFKLTSSSYPKTLSGTQVLWDEWIFNSGAIRCEQASYSGSISGASEEPELTPSYSECTSLGFVEVPVDVNGCKYRFHASSEPFADNFGGSFDIVCGSSPITFTAPGCTVTLGSQNGLGPISYRNTTGGTSEVDVSINASLMLYTVDSGCSTTKAGTFGNGRLVGEFILKGSGGVWFD